MGRDATHDCFANLHDKLDRNTTITPQNCSLDAAVSESFKQQAMQQIGGSGYPHIIIDLQNVTFIDCSGLGSLLYILRQVTAIGGEAALTRVSEAIRGQLETARIDKLFKIIDSDSDMPSPNESGAELAVEAY